MHWPPALYNAPVMSLITRCPACGTLFKVVPDQLRISEGWVRCGQCEEVFDGNVNLQSAAAELQPESPVPVAENRAEAPASPPANPPATDYDWSEVLEPNGSGSELAESAAEPVAAMPEVSVEEVAVQEREELPVLPPDLAVVDGSRVSAPPDVVQTVLAPEEDPVFAASPALSHEPALEDGSVRTEMALSPLPAEELNLSPLGTLTDIDAVDATESLRYVQADAPLPAPLQDLRPSFMARKPVRQRSRLVQASLVLLCGGLSLLLVVQVLVRERDRIAAYQPGSKPVLQAVCEAVGCQVGPLRQIETLAIESSSFSKIRSDIYRLSFAIRNPAHIELALPAMELTLTDSQDKVLLRRVLQPADLGPVDVIGPGAEFSTSMAVQVKLGSLNERVAGYRLLAFYP